MCRIEQIWVAFPLTGWPDSCFVTADMRTCQSVLLSRYNPAGPKDIVSIDICLGHYVKTDRQVGHDRILQKMRDDLKRLQMNA